ncbi:MAG TPA: tetratricopeptide repeat protein, partial [Coleofasciculaceae cyanobacterium]
MKADLHKTNSYKILSSNFSATDRGQLGFCKKFILYALLFTISLVSITLTHPPITDATTPTIAQVPTNPQTLIQQGESLYEAGQFAEAVTILQQATEAFKNQGDGLNQAMSLSNLSLAYQHLGQWKEAQDAITASLQLLENPTTKELLKLRGDALDIQGQLYLAQGQPEAALESFLLATAAYSQAGDAEGNFRSQINQAQALQSSGLYRRALNILQPLNLTLQKQPDSHIKAIALRSLGNTLRMIGNLEESQNNLEQSLAIAQRLPSPLDISAALLGLGNTARANGEIQAAFTYYQQASDIENTLVTTKIKAQLNLLSLFVSSPQLLIESEFLQEIQTNIAQLPVSLNAINARINLARSLMKLENPENDYSLIIAEQLKVALQQAQTIHDSRSQSYALGQLGELYEKTGQYNHAQKLTEQALVLSQSIDASDIAYSLQWQLGRLLKVQGNRDGAIAAYTSAVNTLQSLRRDLVSINPDVQFSFRESVEPVYRELVSLLLQSQGSEPTQQNLIQARDAIESLQQAELVNFFREDCLNAVPILIDQVDQKAAVIYPIVLNDRLEVVLSLPDEPLRHYATVLPKAELEHVFSQ